MLDVAWTIEQTLPANSHRAHLPFRRSRFMMAFDRTRGPSTLDPAMVNELRDTLSRSLQAGNHSDDLKTVLERAAADARQKGLQAEQLMLALKDIWYSLPGITTHPANDVQTRLLQQLIARCIQEYYAR